MPIYEWKCRRCGSIKETTEQYLQAACPVCGDTFRRKYSVHTPHPNHVFEPHFNISIGQHVTSMSDFKSKLSRKSDEMSERLGVDHNYQPVEPNSNIGATDV